MGACYHKANALEGFLEASSPGESMDAAEIRNRFVRYFEQRGHRRVPSAPLIPQNDPTLFFVNAGMVPFKGVFTGSETRPYTRATSCQKILRVSGKHNDLDNVGRTPRHHTFFEMLGNFSFGDYFKKEAIEFAWRFLLDELNMPIERLWVTVYEDDDEAYELWKAIGVPEKRLQRLGAETNFWSMGPTGPCGYNSEIFFDHGETFCEGDPGPASDEERYVEIWNLVFMQFNRDADGKQTDLPHPSIDTGAGLERLACALQGVSSNFDTDLFQPLIQHTAQATGTPYGQDPEVDTALRIIADHARATAFLIAEGVMPSNEGRGYVLRRIMRRAIRFGVKLGMQELFFHNATDQVIAQFGEAYPDLTTRQSFVADVVKAEEKRFRATLERGMGLLDTEITSVGDGGVLSGETVFTLSDTYGFPMDLTRQIAQERNVSVDEEGFKKALAAQRARGRAAWKGSGEEAVAGLWHELAKSIEATTFCGYERGEIMSSLLCLVRCGADEASAQTYEQVDVLNAGERGIALLASTPFYAEAGGQVGDHGSLSSTAGSATVTDTSQAAGLVLHHVTVNDGTLEANSEVRATISAAQRDQTRRNHTATHLLHSALQQVLGDHVTQKGSLVGPQRLRFDFSHHKAMTADEMAAVQNLVNQQILLNSTVNTSVEDLQAAKARGVTALFGEKYEAQVRVVSVGEFSTELCGGTHVDATGEIGLLLLVSESGIAAGVRRIEAQTGQGALTHLSGQIELLEQAAGSLKTQPAKLVSAIERLQRERQETRRELQALRNQLASEQATSLLDSAQEIDGVNILAATFDGDLREQADRLRDQLGSSLIVLASSDGKGVRLLAAASKDIAGSRIHAGKIIQAIAPMVDGRGGGRPDMAQAGGKDPGGIQAALDHALVVAKEQLQA